MLPPANMVSVSAHPHTTTPLSSTPPKEAPNPGNASTLLFYEYHSDSHSIPSPSTDNTVSFNTGNNLLDNPGPSVPPPLCTLGASMFPSPIDNIAHPIPSYANSPTPEPSISHLPPADVPVVPIVEADHTQASADLTSSTPSPAAFSPSVPQDPLKDSNSDLPSDSLNQGKSTSKNFLRRQVISIQVILIPSPQTNLFLSDCSF